MVAMVAAVMDATTTTIVVDLLAATALVATVTGHLLAATITNLATVAMVVVAAAVVVAALPRPLVPVDLRTTTLLLAAATRTTDTVLAPRVIMDALHTAANLTLVKAVVVVAVAAVTVAIVATVATVVIVPIAVTTTVRLLHPRGLAAQEVVVAMTVDTNVVPTGDYTQLLDMILNRCSHV